MLRRSVVPQASIIQRLPGLQASDGTACKPDCLRIICQPISFGKSCLANRSNRFCIAVLTRSFLMFHCSFCYCFGQQKRARFVHVERNRLNPKHRLSCAGGERDLPVGLGLIIMFFCLLVVYCHGRPLSGKMTTSSPSVFNSYPRGRYYPSHETVPNKEPGAKLCKKITPIGVLQIVDGESII